MSVTFDGQNLLIIINNGITSVSADTIYSLWKQWVKSGSNAGFPPAFRTIGGDNLGGGLEVGAYYFLQNQYGWRIRPYEGNHELTITGNIYAEDTTKNTFVPTLGNYTTVIRSQVSSLTQQTAFSSEGIGNAVWNVATGSFAANTMGQMQSLLANIAVATNFAQNVLGSSWLIENNQLTFYASGSNEVVARFDLMNSNNQPVNGTTQPATRRWRI